ncbi:hypothetical protein B0H12DRAFT_33075 [Mycena haematopus]|nr:hypothetical protein B0H12DRAFT_33075 [Mycena haematopus]
MHALSPSAPSTTGAATATETASTRASGPRSPQSRDLASKGRLWETEARRFTEERCKHAALKRRQDVAAGEQERIRLIKQKEAAAAAVDLRRQRIKPTARTLNFALVPPAPKPAPKPQKFTYDFPFTPRNIPHEQMSLRAAARPSANSGTHRNSSTNPPRLVRRGPRVHARRPLPRSPLRAHPLHKRGPYKGATPACPTRCSTTCRCRPRFRRKRQGPRALPAAVCVCPCRIRLSLHAVHFFLVLGPVARGLLALLQLAFLPLEHRHERQHQHRLLLLGLCVRHPLPLLLVPPGRLAPAHQLAAVGMAPGARRTSSPEPTYFDLPNRKCQCQHRLRRVHAVPRTPVSTHPLHVPPDPPVKRRGKSFAGAHDHPQRNVTSALGRLAALARMCRLRM